MVVIDDISPGDPPDCTIDQDEGLLWKKSWDASCPHNNNKPFICSVERLIILDISIYIVFILIKFNYKCISLKNPSGFLNNLLRNVDFVITCLPFIFDDHIAMNELNT